MAAEDGLFLISVTVYWKYFRVYCWFLIGFDFFFSVSEEEASEDVQEILL